jgi:hypothetical protein
MPRFRTSAKLRLPAARECVDGGTQMPAPEYEGAALAGVGLRLSKEGGTALLGSKECTLWTFDCQGSLVASPGSWRTNFTIRDLRLRRDNTSDRIPGDWSPGSYGKYIDNWDTSSDGRDDSKQRSVKGMTYVQ